MYEYSPLVRDMSRCLSDHHGVDLINVLFGEDARRRLQLQALHEGLVSGLDQITSCGGQLLLGVEHIDVVRVPVR